MKKALNEIIMDYWYICAMHDGKSDRDIKNLLQDFVESCGRTYDGSDIDRTVRNLTKAEQRKLLKTMQESGIIDRCGGNPETD